VVFHKVVPEAGQAGMRLVGRGAAKEFESVTLSFMEEPSVGAIKEIVLKVAIRVCADKRLQVIKDVVPAWSRGVSSRSPRQAPCVREKKLERGGRVATASCAGKHRTGVNLPPSLLGRDGNRDATISALERSV
jgi:hypothetical protein